MRSFVLALHKLSAQSGIDNFPGQDFSMGTGPAGVQVRIDSRLANRGVQVTMQARGGFDDLGNAAIA